MIWRVFLVWLVSITFASADLPRHSSLHSVVCRGSVPQYDANGNLTNDGTRVFPYDAFGKMLKLEGPLSAINRYWYSSKKLIPQPQIYSYGRRFYEPSLQRFLNRDPIQEWGGINLYRAMGNNLVNIIDPIGFGWFSDLGDALVSPIASLEAGNAQAQGTAALNQQLSAYGYSGAGDFQLANPTWNGNGNLTAGNPQAAAAAANIAAGATQLELDFDQVVAPEAAAAKGAEDAAAAAEDAAAAAAKAKPKCNWKSVKQFGHTFSEHGANRPLQQLIDRANSLGQSQGQWLNNGNAADFLSQYQGALSGPTTVPIPAGLGQVVNPDGSISAATQAIIVPSSSGGIRTAYPVP